MNKNLLAAGVMAMLGTGGMGAQAAMLNTGDVLNITAGVTHYDSNNDPTNVTASWFGMDMNGSASISGTEKTAINPGTDGGVFIGTTQAPGRIDYWSFFGNFGYDYTTVAPTGGTTAGINLSGWVINWNGIPAINMGSGAWGAGFSNGVANFVWDGVYGHAYTLDYAATVPLGDPSGFGGVRYRLHLEGMVGPVGEGDGFFVPLPAAAWLFGSGLLGLLGMSRRHRT